MRSGREIVLKRCCGFFCHQFVAEHAGFFPGLFGRKAPQQDQQRLGGLPVGGAMRQHAFDHPAPQSLHAQFEMKAAANQDGFSHFNRTSNLSGTARYLRFAFCRQPREPVRSARAAAAHLP
jgi:hypothetical protein